MKRLVATALACTILFSSSSFQAVSVLSAFKEKVIGLFFPKRTFNIINDWNGHMYMEVTTDVAETLFGVPKNTTMPTFVWGDHIKKIVIKSAFSQREATIETEIPLESDEPVNFTINKRDDWKLTLGDINEEGTLLFVE